MDIGASHPFKYLRMKELRKCDWHQSRDYREIWFQGAKPQYCPGKTEVWDHRMGELQ